VSENRDWIWPTHPGGSDRGPGRVLSGTGTLGGSDRPGLEDQAVARVGYFTVKGTLGGSRRPGVGGSDRGRDRQLAGKGARPGSDRLTGKHSVGRSRCIPCTPRARRSATEPGRLWVGVRRPGRPCLKVSAAARAGALGEKTKEPCPRGCCLSEGRRVVDPLAHIGAEGT